MSSEVDAHRLRGGKRESVAAVRAPWRFRLRDAPIRAKALLVLLVPAVALLAVAGLGLFSAANAAVRAGQTVTMAQVGDSAAEITDALQAERVAVTAVLSPGSGSEARTVYEERISRTTTATERFTRLRGSLPHQAGRIGEVLAEVDGALTDVAGQRLRVRSGQPVALSTSTFSYRIAVAALIDYREAVAQVSGDADLAGQLRAAAQLSRAKEAVGLEQIAVLQALAAGVMSPALAQNVVAARAAFTDAAETFQRLALPMWLPVFQQSLTGGDALDATVLAGTVARTGAAAPVVLPGGGAAWNRVMSARAGRLRVVEQRADADVIAAAAAVQRSQVMQAGFQGTVGLVTLLLAMGVTAMVTRSIVRPIQALQAGARHVGETLLPAMANDLRFVASLVEAEARTAEAASSSRLVVPGHDEIGALAQTVNDLIGQFVRTSGALAVGRITGAGQVTTLARRVQSLIDQLLHGLDGLEHDADPDTLAQLFVVDNRAAQLRRLVANMLVLSGTGTGRAHTRAEPLLDLVRAATSEIERYDQVVPIALPEVFIDPRAVLALKQMLAELLDNATQYGRPKEDVQVSGALMVGILVLRIDDSGQIAEERLARNNQLLQDAAADLGLLHQMGLAVVARLAHPLRMTVRLERRSDGGPGTTAWVQIPQGLFHLSAGRAATPPMPALPAGQNSIGAPPIGSHPHQQTWPPTTEAGAVRAEPRRPKHARDDDTEDPADSPTIVQPAMVMTAVASPWLSGEPLTNEHPAGAVAGPALGGQPEPLAMTEAGLPQRPRTGDGGGGWPQTSVASVPPARPRDPAAVAAQTSAIAQALRTQSAYNSIPRQRGSRDDAAAGVPG